MLHHAYLYLVLSCTTSDPCMFCVSTVHVLFITVTALLFYYFFILFYPLEVLSCNILLSSATCLLCSLHAALKYKGSMCLASIKGYCERRAISATAHTMHCRIMMPIPVNSDDCQETEKGNQIKWNMLYWGIGLKLHSWMKKWLLSAASYT